MTIEKLKALDEETAKLTKDLEYKLIKASRDCDSVCRNLFDQRAAIVGNVGGGEEAEDEEAASSKGIPGFWSNVFQRDDKMVDSLGPEDEEILAYLKDARATTTLDKDGYTVKLTFRPNPYFKNPVLERTDTIEQSKLGGKELRFIVSRATKIEWTQPPAGGKRGKKGGGKAGKGGKGKKGKSTAVEEEEEGAPEEHATENVQLQYGKSFFAFFNPPNLTDLLPPGTTSADAGPLLEEVIKKGDTRFGKVQTAMMQDRAIAKHVWLDLVPRAGLHFIAAADQPSYQCPMGLGLNSAAEERVDKMLAIQKKLDEKRADLADELRRLRTEGQAQIDLMGTQRKEALKAAGDDSPLELFWLTALRNVPDLWTAVTDRDELALRHLTDVSWAYTSSRQGQTEPEDTDYMMAPQNRAYKVELHFAENDFFSDSKLWVEVSFKGGDTVSCKSSGVTWKEGKCISARQRDVSPAAVKRFRPSMFLLFEATAAEKGPNAGRGLMDEHEKLAIARVLKGEVAARAAKLYLRNPENDGREERAAAEAEGEDLMDDTDEEDVEEEEGSESDSDEDDLQTKAEKAVEKRKKKEGGLYKKVFGQRDPCFVFVIFIMALNLIIIPMSYFMD